MLQARDIIRTTLEGVLAPVRRLGLTDKITSLSASHGPLPSKLPHEEVIRSFILLLFGPIGAGRARPGSSVTLCSPVAHHAQRILHQSAPVAKSVG